MMDTIDFIAAIPWQAWVAFVVIFGPWVVLGFIAGAKWARRVKRET